MTEPRRTLQEFIDGGSKVVRERLKPFQWQLQIWPRWKAAGFKGIVEALPGAGKTHGALFAVEQYVKEKGLTRPKIRIVVPNRELKRQWESVIEVNFHHLKGRIVVETIQAATRQARDISVADLMMMTSEEKYGLVDALVIDEVHGATATTFSRIFKTVSSAVLGLTATVTAATESLAGASILKVGWQDVPHAEFEVRFLVVPLHADQEIELSVLGQQILRALSRRKRTHEDMVGLQRALQRRRDLLYELPQRIEITEAIVLNQFPTPDEVPKRVQPTLIICRRVAQANRIYELLKAKLGSKRVGVYHSGDVVTGERIVPQASLEGKQLERKEYMMLSEVDKQLMLDDFKRGAIDVMVSVEMLKEGFDYPALSRVIVVAPVLNEQKYIQMLGRAIRNYPGKKAVIYFLLANQSSELQLLDYRWAIGEKGAKYMPYPSLAYYGNRRLSEEDVESFKYARGMVSDFADAEHYGWDGEHAYRKGAEGRVPYAVNPELKTVLEATFGSEPDVYGIIGTRFIYLGDAEEGEEPPVREVALEEIPEHYRLDMAGKAKSPKLEAGAAGEQLAAAAKKAKEMW